MSSCVLVGASVSSQVSLLLLICFHTQLSFPVLVHTAQEDIITRWNNSLG